VKRKTNPTINTIKRFIANYLLFLFLVFVFSSAATEIWFGTNPSFYPPVQAQEIDIIDKNFLFRDGSIGGLFLLVKGYFDRDILLLTGIFCIAFYRKPRAGDAIGKGGPRRDVKPKE